MKSRSFLKVSWLFWIWLLSLVNISFWYSNTWIQVIKDKYKTSIEHMFDWWQTLKKEYHVQNWWFLWSEKDREKKIDENSWEEIWWYTKIEWFWWNWWQKNWRFLSTNNSLVSDSFLEWWFYRLNVWNNNYWFYNTFYVWTKNTNQFDFVIKSFLDIDQRYQSFAWWDWLLTYLKRHNLTTKYLWFWFMLTKSITDLWISSYDFNNALQNYLATNKTSLLSTLNTLELNQTHTISLTINSQTVNVIVFPFQKNPYFQLNQFNNKYTNVWVYKSSTQQCWSFKSDLKWNWSQLVNLYDYDSYIENCWSKNVPINQIIKENYDTTFSSRYNLWSVQPWMYMLTLMNINQLLFWSEKISEHVVNEWFSINYWFSFVSNNTIEVYDAFKWKFTTSFLNFLKTYDIATNWFDWAFKAYSDIWKIYELTNSSDLYESKKEQSTLSSIKANTLYWHYRNIKDLLSIHDNNVVKILWKTVNSVTTKYEYWVLNNEYTLYENLWNSDWLTDRWVNISTKTITTNCLSNWHTQKNDCIHSSFVLNDMFSKNWPWIQNYLNANSIFHTIKWESWKDIYQWTYSTAKQWVDYDKLFIWMWSKSWTQQWIVFSTFWEYLWHIWDFKETNKPTWKELSLWWNKLDVTQQELRKNEVLHSNLTYKDWTTTKHYWTIWNYILWTWPDYSWYTTVWWTKLWLSSLEWTKNWTTFTTDVNTTTVSYEDLWSLKVKEQNSYWYYEFSTQWIYQNWIKVSLYSTQWNKNERWVVFWLNWLWIDYSNDRRWFEWDIYPSYYMVWKKYYEDHLKWFKFEINNWERWSWIFTTWTIQWDQYIISYDKKNILSSKNDAIDKYNTTKLTWTLTWRLKNAVLQNFILNTYWQKFRIDLSWVRKKTINWSEYLDFNMYVWEKDWSLNIFFEVTDTASPSTTWLLPVTYNAKTWEVSFYNKIKKNWNLNWLWTEKFHTFIATKEWLDIKLTEYTKIDFDTYSPYYLTTYSTFTDDLYYQKVLPENYSYDTNFDRSLYKNITNNYTIFREWTKPSSIEIIWWQEFWWFEKYKNEEYYSFDKASWSVQNLIWLTREFYNDNWTPLDLHKMNFKFEWEKKYSWFKNLFLVSIYDEKPQYITIFDNKSYLTSPWNHQIISNYYWEWWQILESLDDQFKLNKFNTAYIKQNVENQQLKSQNYYHTDYKLNNKVISNTDYTTNTTAKYKIKLITNFEEITKWTIKTEVQWVIKKYITTRLMCWWTEIWKWENISISNLNLNDWTWKLKDCYIEVSVNIVKEWWEWSLWKLSWQIITIKTHFINKFDNWSWKIQDIDAWEKENKIVINDITLLSSLPYDSIQTIPNCRVIVKTKDTIDTWNWVTIANSSSISWKYSTIEIDVLYKNPKLTPTSTWDKTLKWVVIDLWIVWNGKFENYWSEYFNVLSNVYQNSDHLSDTSKQFLQEIKNNSIFWDKKIQYFVWASHYKRTQFFWKTTFYIKSSTPNLNQFMFNLQWSCTFKYFWWSDIKKPLEWSFSFRHPVEQNNDFSNLEYYNVDWRDKTLYWNWFSKVQQFWNEYLLKQYQPSVASLTYIHNGKADNIISEPRIDKNNTIRHWEYSWLTYSPNLFAWRNQITTNNAPYNWSKWSWTNQSWYWYSLLWLLKWYQRVQHKINYEQNSWSCCWRCWWRTRWYREDIWESENNVFDLRKHYNNCTWNAKTSNMAHEWWKSWIDWKTWQAFWWYNELKFNWYFSIWLKQVWTEWTQQWLLIDRVFPYCMWQQIASKYWTKLLDLWWWNKLFVVDTLTSLSQTFLDKNKNSMLSSNWCTLTSWSEIDILSTKHTEKNAYNLKWKKSLTKENWFPFFFSTTLPLEQQLPQTSSDVKKTFVNNVKVDLRKLIQLYVADELKNEIQSVSLNLKIDPNDVSSSNTTWKVKVKFELKFNLKYQDKTRPNHVKWNKLYKYLEEWDPNKTLFDLQMPLLAISSFNESFSLNETSLVNKVMIKWDNTITKEVVKTSPVDNFEIQWSYKKFVVSEYRIWKNRWRIIYRRRTWSCNTYNTCAIYNEWTYADWSLWTVIPYVWWMNPTLYKLKNEPIKNNIISTFFQYTDSIWAQIANKTLMINWIPSIKNIWDNQILFEWLCDVCWQFQWNIFENQSVWMFNSKVVLNKQWTTNIFKYYEDPRYFEIKKTVYWEWSSNNFQLNWILTQDKKDWQPYVDLALIKKNWIPEITPQWVWELWWAVYYSWKKVLLIKWDQYKSTIYKPQPLIISTDILPKTYKNFESWKKIEDELVIASDWDIIIWPDVTLINAVLLTKWNLIILNWNNSLKIHWWTIIQWRIYNYRININDINTRKFWDNYTKMYKNVELFNMKYPVFMTIDQRYLNSKIFNFIETVYRSTSRW